MKKNILPLIIVFNLYICEANAQFIEIKKEKAVLENKVIITKDPKILPFIVENSIAIESSLRNEIFGSSLIKKGKFAYVLDAPMLLSNINNKQDTIELSDNDNTLNLLSFEFDTNKKLKVALIGKSKKIMITNGSFIVEFKDINDQNKFSEDYDLIVIQKSPKYITFKSKTFSGINDLIKTINQDTRVNSIELNLIDPDLKTN